MENVYKVLDIDPKYAIREFNISDADGYDSNVDDVKNDTVQQSSLNSIAEISLN